MTLLRTLGIETSCDESAVAVLDADGRVEVSLLSSQIEAHAPFGGVVPELASREHLKALPFLTSRALEEARGPAELVAVTAGPGLIGALLVGVRFAAAFAWGRMLPLIAVDHLEGHLVSSLLSLDGQPARAEPERVLALVASGGHSSWYLVNRGSRERLGRTRDDAAGESFDKVAQLLGLGYPGGPELDALARKGQFNCRDHASRTRRSISPFRASSRRRFAGSGSMTLSPPPPPKSLGKKSVILRRRSRARLSNNCLRPCPSSTDCIDHSW